MAITYMTKEGYKKKMEEIAFLENVKRPEISRAIAEARDKGDLSENAEYDAAKEAQGMLEMKIAQLKDLVAHARIIDDSKLNTDEVQILNKVKIKNVANGQVMEYTIVADSEAFMSFSTVMGMRWMWAWGTSRPITVMPTRLQGIAASTARATRRAKQ